MNFAEQLQFCPIIEEAGNTLFRNEAGLNKKRGKEMERSTIIALWLAVVLFLPLVLFLPNVVFSDCLSFARVGPLSWQVQNERTIVFYDGWGTNPIARVTLQTCRINESSVIRLSKRYLCDTDKIIVDNRPCSIVTITSASSGSF